MIVVSFYCLVKNSYIDYTKNVFNNLTIMCTLIVPLDNNLI